MIDSILDDEDLHTLEYIITHVFFPLKLPNGDDHSVSNDRSLAAAITTVARIYSNHVDHVNMPEWRRVSGMLENLQNAVQFQKLDRAGTISQLGRMMAGDVLAFLIRAQNAAVVCRKQKDVTIFESFEISPQAKDVMAVKGKLICSYPGPAIQVPNVVFEDECFVSELVNFLVRMNDDILDAAPKSRKAQSTVIETRDTTHPRYITELLTGILRGIGTPADTVRISKRIGDDVVWKDSNLPWRRSSLWLVIRVVLQTSLGRSGLGHRTYKEFMLFFMCRLGQEEICAGLANDVLQCMLAKISRRLRKLGSSAPEWLSFTAMETCVSLQSILEERWRQVQASQRVSPPWDPSRLNLNQDSQLSLKSSGDYIRNVPVNHSVHPSHTPFNPRHRPRGTLDKFLSSDGAFFEQAYCADPHVALYDVERVISQEIDAWIGRVIDRDEACVKLEILARKYSSGALETYENNPELLSIMMLAMIEIWIALDKIAIEVIPMLADYSPEVPTALLEDLLLCKDENLHRLRRAHQYLSDRHSRSQSGSSVFSFAVNGNSFAVRFYRSSSHLQSLKAEIEEAADRDVHQKLVELKDMNARYVDIQQQAAELQHEYAFNRDGSEYHARHDCSKCDLERELCNLKISVHEWPLPAEQLRAEAVVFELDCPVSFNMWRTVTLHLLVDISGSSPVEERHPYILLSKYSALQPYLVQHPIARITLASDTKPFTVTHYSKVPIPSTREGVCFKNGLAFYGYDSHAHIPISGALSCVDISKYCTYQLQDGPYESLQKYVDATSHTSNEVMASQADCDKNLSIHECIAFGHLRSGGVLQWLSILRELRGRSLSFQRPEVHFLLAQAASQVGPFANTGWTWHQEIQQPSFCHAILGELEALIRDVEANWQEAASMDTISFLLRRLLASTCDGAVSQKAVQLLRTVRLRAFSWVKELEDKLAHTEGDNSNEELGRILRDTAAICRSTFNVDSAMVPRILYSATDIEILLSSAVFIHDHTPNKVSSLPAYSRLLLDRDRRLSLALESAVSDAIEDNDRGMDQAIARVWPHYRPGSKWVPSPTPNSRWLSCKTASTSGQRSQDVHFNLLDGSLLVDGKPVGRLPNKIQRHPLYDLIFGEARPIVSNKVLEVLPSAVSGMEYSTKNMISGHQVHFSLGDETSDLVIRATVNSQIIELIPQGKLEGDLPDVLIEGHAHWLNLSTSVMEIRPLDSLWNSSSENWKMDCTLERHRMYRDRELLVDIRSQSWAMVSALFKPLDVPQNLLVTVSPADSDQPSTSLQLSVVLPRYSLSFCVDEDGDVRSRNIRGMVYDENQSIGTLFGLVNRFVLKPKLRGHIIIDELVPRCILIPEGAISFQTDGHHVRVEIDTSGPAVGRVTCQTYWVDSDLGNLTGNGSLTNKLYCAYLHALTSGSGTDPLTGRSGTEEAVSLLRSASCWSMMRLDSRSAELLSSIASIFPPRTWYPTHLKCMQTVEWRDLPVKSQCHELYLVCEAIKEHYKRVQLFHESQSDKLFQDFPSLDDHLLGRSAQRAVYLFPPEFSQQHPKQDFDVRYSARDLVQAGSGEHRAYVAAAIVHRKTVNTPITINILNMAESWKGTVLGNTTLSLRYDSSWLAPDLPSIWLKAYKILRGSEERKWAQLLFSLPAMAYGSSNLTDLVPTFVAFAADLRFRLEDPPHYDSYKLSEGYYPDKAILRGYILDCTYLFPGSPESTSPEQAGESYKQLQVRRRDMYNKRRGSDAEAAACELVGTWPCETPPRCSRLKSNLYDVAELTSNAQRHFSSCHHNCELKDHLARVQEILNKVSSKVFPMPSYHVCPSESVPSCSPWIFTMEQIFARPVPLLQAPDGLPQYTAAVPNASPPSSASLHQLIDTATANATNQFQQQYISALGVSADHIGSETSVVACGALPTAETLVEHYKRCRAGYSRAVHRLQECLGPRDRSEQTLEQSGQWPRITPYALFRSLASNSPIVLSDDWKRCLIRLCLLALELQRAGRLLRLHLDNLKEELRKELENEGCDGWDAESHPDWLLIQLQGNFLVRRVQADVASEMIAPRSGNNTAMQLNMGEGKSSVIIPIVVTVLANGNQLVRVIVPKALTAQMFHLLADRLGGLVDRRIYFIPFSRSSRPGVDVQKVTALRELMSECMKERGILVVQPEHVLSLRLVSVEKQLPGAKDSQLANVLLGLQRWLQSHSRDILDESDEILHVRYQLVYTIGRQLHMEGSPERWTTTQQVLGLVSKHASSLQRLFPDGVEVEYDQDRPGSFPHFRILHADAGQELISYLVRDVMDDQIPNLSFGQVRSEVKDAIRNFISCVDVPPQELRLVKEYAERTPLWSGLLLVRGLLATGVLLFAFRERRWRVDYGLVPARTMFAVPYRAKDIPAQRAEFGHPDIAITLTCLSYYYGGLTEEQLRVSFELLFRQDDPSLDYDLWVRACPTMPENLCTLNGVNIRSPDQWKSLLFPLFSRNRATVDFYLSSVVFPKEAKEFPSKLSCSGWDLAENKEHPVTGFSGTNDGQYLLPLHITQRDPDHQRGTNAKVLSYLLQSENKQYVCMTDENGKRRTTPEFLEILVAQTPEIRVLLDVGAQMLDLQNEILAREWLGINKKAFAAIYFNEDDELAVLTRDGNAQLLISSPFAQQLDQCVVYLDDAHTRGTDIKFPSGFRAAVTLGPKVTKDRLTQGCMRMRKLGHGHSVMFFAPREVDGRIRFVTGKNNLDAIDTMDILHWAIRETCDDIQQRVPHWAQQGSDHTLRYIAWTSFCKNQLSAEALSEKWLQPEAKKLEDLYGPGRHGTSSTTSFAVPSIRQRCVNLGISSLRDVSLDEEQEREVVHEAELERQVERPPRVDPAIHTLHRDVSRFITTGVVPAHTIAFRPVFDTLDQTSAATDEAHVWSPLVLATADFEKTVTSEDIDEYLRPVQWVVSGKRGTDGRDVLVILSPYEASRLIPDIRLRRRVHLHVYTPRVARTVKACDDLALYSVPAVSARGWIPPHDLMDQLNMFAGQLYLEDYDTYVRLCRFLGVRTAASDSGDTGTEVQIGADGFVAAGAFEHSPVGPLRRLMGLRRKGMRFAPTHMGKLVDGRLLHEADFDGHDES